MTAAAVAVLLAGWAFAQCVTGGWRRVWLRWQWPSIARSAGLTTTGPHDAEHAPRLLGVFGRPVGPLTARCGASWRCWAAQGGTTADIAAAADKLAAAAWSRRVVVDTTSPRAARITVLWRDPFDTTRPWHTPVPGRLRPGFDVHAEPIDVPILDPWGGSWLIGGASGSGKSAWLGAVVADLARQPATTTTIVGIDLKRVELEPWAPALAALAVTRHDADDLLGWTRDLIDRRTVDLAAAGMRHVPAAPSTDWPVVALVIDELATLLAGRGEDTDHRRRLLVEIAQLGRAAGVLLVCATQRPTTDAVPAALRDQLGRRVLCRVPTLDAGRAVLGWQPRQADLDQLDRPGLALVDLPGRRTILARSTFGNVAAVEQLAGGVPCAA